MKLECLRWLSGVHSTYSNRPSRTSFNHLFRDQSDSFPFRLDGRLGIEHPFYREVLSNGNHRQGRDAIGSQSPEAH